MQYQLDNNTVINFDLNFINDVEVDFDIVLPLLSIKDKGSIYRGIYITYSVEYSTVTPDFFEQGDNYRMIMDYRVSNPDVYVYKINDVAYSYDRTESSMGGVYFYYKHDESEIYVAQGQMGGNANINVPLSYGIPTSLSIGIVTQLENSLMINAKAPYGSSEDDAVWTVYINPLDEFGNVVEEEIEVLENQIWSEIKNMYN